MMEDSPQACSSFTVSSSGSPLGACATASQRQSLRRVVVADRVEVRDLLSRRRELTGLLADAQRENDVLRVQMERSAAALDAGGESSDLSQALRKHAKTVRILQEDMRTVRIHERSTECKLKKKVYDCRPFMSTLFYNSS